MIEAANTEAEACPNGIGIVKLMGRHSGFIALHATLASGDVRLCLVPESSLVAEIMSTSKTNYEKITTLSSSSRKVLDKLKWGPR